VAPAAGCNRNGLPQQACRGQAQRAAEDDEEPGSGRNSKQIGQSVLHQQVRPGGGEKPVDPSRYPPRNELSGKTMASQAMAAEKAH